MSPSDPSAAGEAASFAGLDPRERNALVADRIFGKPGLRERPFGTDLLTAMLVVERISEEGFVFRCSVSADGRARVNFLCKDDPCPRHGTAGGGDHGVAGIEGESLPAAICIAALELHRRIRPPADQS